MISGTIINAIWQDEQRYYRTPKDYCVTNGPEMTNEEGAEYLNETMPLAKKEKRMGFKVVNATNIMGGKRDCIHSRPIHIHCEHCENMINPKEPKRMTREETIAKISEASRAKGNLRTRSVIENDLLVLEILGLIKFDEPKKVNILFNYGKCAEYDNPVINKIVKKYGTIRLEEWPEGLVLWVGGEIVWKSWEKTYKPGDHVLVANPTRERNPNIYKGVIICP